MEEFTEVNELDLSKGLDKRNAENQLTPGHWEELVNADIDGRLVSKRKGYQQIGGYLPFRVQSVEGVFGTNEVCFNLADYVDLSRIDTSSPIRIEGTFYVEGNQNAEFNGDFPLNDFFSRYYENYTVTIRRSGNSTIPGAAHGHSSAFQHSDVALSNSGTNLSHTQFIPDVHEINYTDGDEPGGLQNTELEVTGSDKYIHYSYGLTSTSPNDFFPTNFISGDPEYLSPDNVTGELAPGLDLAQVVNNTNVIVSVFQKTGAGVLQKVIPEDIRVDDGLLYIDLKPGLGSNEYTYMVTSVPPEQVVSGQTVGATTTATFAVDNPFNIVNIYTTSVTGGVITKEWVIPNSISYDDTSGELSVEFTSDTNTNYEIYYLPAGLQVNQICVATSLGNNIDRTSTNIEVDIYGIDPAEAAPQADRNHWATHIDTYRSVDSSKLLTGVAGNEYELAPRLQPSVLPKIRALVADQQRLSPLFQDTGTVAGGVNNRGYYTFAGGGNGGEIDEAAWQSGNTVRFTILAPDLDSLAENGAAGEPTIQQDLLTVTGMGYSVLNGEHPITAITKVDEGTADGKLLVDVTIAAVSNADFNEQDAGGLAQVYTSYIDLNTVESPFLPGDLLVGGPFPGSVQYEVRGLVGGASELVLINGVVDEFELSGGSTMYASRKAYNIPFRTPGTGPRYVKGDMLKYSAVPRFSRITSINLNETEDVTIARDVVTLPAGLAVNYAEGQRVFIQSFGTDGGELQITELINDDQIRIDTELDSTSGRLIGETIEIDEKFTYADTVDDSEFFQPTQYWRAVQKPDLPAGFAENTTGGFVDRELKRSVRQQFNTFIPGDQPIVRSSMAADNLYLTNGDDPVLKYDGTRLSRAGLFRFEAGAFVNIVSSGPNITDGGIVNSAVSVDADTDSADGKKITGGSISFVFAVGQVISVDLGTSVETVTVLGVDQTPDSIIVDTTLPTSTAVTVTASSTLKYYFRLNLFDANNNRIGSATSGVNNAYVIDLEEKFSTVGVKIAIPPRVRLLDYERLEVQTYRTTQEGEVFFLLRTDSVPYTDGSAYIYFEDTAADNTLTQPDFLAAATFGAELPTAIEEPLRAKYITSANNRMVLGNVKDYPKVDMEYIDRNPGLDLLRLEFVGDTTIAYEFASSGGRVLESHIESSSGQLTVGANDGSGSTVSADTWVYIFNDNPNNNTNLSVAGWYKGDHVFAATSDITDHKVIVGSSANTVPIADREDDYNSANAGWRGSSPRLQFLKLARAINSTAGQLDGPNWLRAEGGLFEQSESGRVSVRSLSSDFVLNIDNTFAVEESFLLINGTQYSLEDNAPLEEPAVSVSSQATKYPSRMLVSFANFPEIFDRPRAEVETDSLSVIDVNSSDGQEITGIIPFFGESTSQDSQKQDIVICFKENSIYAVNIRSRQITKIDSRSLGCDAPYSIAAVPNGIIFANRSGVYRLNRGFDVIWVGNKLDREWDERVNFDQIRLATGHVYAEKQQYRLSVPVESNDRATEVYVYNYGDERSGQIGAWSTFNNIPSTGWASDGTDSFFGSSEGRVFVIRDTGTDADYRDDDQPVSWSGTYRATDFDAPGKRKILRAVISQFRVLKQDAGTTLEVAVDMTSDFVPTTAFTLAQPADDNLSSVTSQKVKTIRQNVGNQKGVYYQLRYSNATIDTPLELSGISYKVAGLKYTGITQAAETE